MGFKMKAAKETATGGGLKIFTPASQALFSAMSSRTPSSDKPQPKSLAQHAFAAASALLLAPCGSMLVWLH